MQQSILDYLRLNDISSKEIIFHQKQLAMQTSVLNLQLADQDLKGIMNTSIRFKGRWLFLEFRGVILWYSLIKEYS